MLLFWKFKEKKNKSQSIFIIQSECKILCSCYTTAARGGEGRPEGGCVSELTG